MDPNNAAYLALRNHPETTIRPVPEIRSPTENEESPRNLEENIFKQVRAQQNHGGKDFVVKTLYRY